MESKLCYIFPSHIFSGRDPGDGEADEGASAALPAAGAEGQTAGQEGEKNCQKVPHD